MLVAEGQGNIGVKGCSNPSLPFTTRHWADSPGRISSVCLTSEGWWRVVKGCVNPSLLQPSVIETLRFKKWRVKGFREYSSALTILGMVATVSIAMSFPSEAFWCTSEGFWCASEGFWCTSEAFWRTADIYWRRFSNCFCQTLQPIYRGAHLYIKGWLPSI